MSWKQQLVFKFKLHLKNVKLQDCVSKREMLNGKFVLLCSIRTSFLSFHKIIRCFLFCFVFFNLARSTIYFIWRFKRLPLRRLKYIKVEYLYVGICLSCSVHRPLFTQVNIILFIAVFFRPCSAHFYWAHLQTTQGWTLQAAARCRNITVSAHKTRNWTSSTDFAYTTVYSRIYSVTGSSVCSRGLSGSLLITQGYANHLRTSRARILLSRNTYCL